MLRPRAWSRWQWIIVPQGAPAHDALIFSLDRSLRTQLQSDAACYGERRADAMHTKKRRIRCAAGPAGRPRLRNRVTFAERASLPCLHHISSPKRTLRLESAALSRHEGKCRHCGHEFSFYFRIYPLRPQVNDAGMQHVDARGCL